MNRSWATVLNHWKIAAIRFHAKFLFVFIFHNIIRWFTMFFVLLSIVSFTFLLAVPAVEVYICFFSAIVVSILGTIAGRLLNITSNSMPSIVNLLYYLYLVGIAGLGGIINSARGILTIRRGPIIVNITTLIASRTLKIEFAPIIEQ